MRWKTAQRKKKNDETQRKRKVAAKDDWKTGRIESKEEKHNAKSEMVKSRRERSKETMIIHEEIRNEEERERKREREKERERERASERERES